MSHVDRAVHGTRNCSIHICGEKEEGKKKERNRGREGERKEERKKDWMYIQKRVTYPCLWELKDKFIEVLISKVSLFLMMLLSSPSSLF
jgi:hypothetical protein